MERARFGREAELARVSSFLDRVPDGPDALVLDGEPGIGKSALWLDALGYAQDRSYRVLSSRPTESEAKLSFAAVGDLLDGVVDEVLEALPAPQRQALATALGLVGGQVPERFFVGLAVLSLLSAVAEQRPVLCLVEDEGIRPVRNTIEEGRHAGKLGLPAEACPLHTAPSR